MPILHVVRRRTDKKLLAAGFCDFSGEFDPAVYEQVQIEADDAAVERLVKSRVVSAALEEQLDPLPDGVPVLYNGAAAEFKELDIASAAPRTATVLQGIAMSRGEATVAFSSDGRTLHKILELRPNRWTRFQLEIFKTAKIYYRRLSGDSGVDLFIPEFIEDWQDSNIPLV